ncbi:MAG: M48 family metallopeptidase [Piscinibacter sp.]|nr:M48 family metallopeptidase [Piscinibacter sp.]
MDGLAVDYFDGRSARAVPARLSFDGASLHLRGENLERQFAPRELRWPERTRHGVRVAELPDGASLHCADGAAWDAFARHCGRGEGWVVRAQQSWRWVLASALATMALLAALYVWGIPAAAQAALALVPLEVDRQIGAAALEQLDEELLKPSRIDALQQRRTRDAFAQALAAQPPGTLPAVRVEFRSSNLGPNAFALPDGTLVLTDELFILADGDADMITGVLAHELGHVRYRHGMRMLLQASAVGVLASIVVGDFNSLLAAAPVVLGQAGYSRDAEREADAESARLLRDAGLSPAVMAAFFEKMARREGGATPLAPLGIAIGSHPADAERIAFFRAAAAQKL